MAGDPRWKYQLHPLPFVERCGFLGADNRCAIRATRPDVCRNLAAGSPQSQEARGRVGLVPLTSAGQGG
jgi:Fe-S-cluster containining protein